MTQPAPELNPITMEHRVTVLEQAQLRTTEAVGNMAKTVERFSQTCAKNEERRVAETVRMQGQLDDVIEGITLRNKMEASFKEGRESVAVRLPWSQLISIAVGAAALGTAAIKIMEAL